MTVLLVAFPLFAVAIVNLPPLARSARLACGITAIFAIWQICLALTAAPSFWSSGWFSLFWHAHGEIDNLARVMFLAIGIVGLASLLAAAGTIADVSQRFKFANLLLLAMAGMNGMSMASDLFSLYLFMEATGAIAFVLIALHCQRDAFEGAYKHMVLPTVASIMLLAAIAIFLMLFGTLDFLVLGRALAARTAPRFLILLATGLLCAGLCLKSGLAPFHGWLLDAYSSAPSAVSVLLAGIVTKATGVYALIRVVIAVFAAPILFDATRDILLAVGALSMAGAALAALGENDFKRMLAYSSISQIGYIVIGVAAGNAVGLAGAIFHLFNHAVFNSLLFVNAAAVEAQTGKRDMRELGGLAERMPWTGATSAIASLSSAGIPPFAGFWSKLLIIVGVWQAGHAWHALLAIIVSVITLAYLIYWQRRVFFGKILPDLESVREADDRLVAASCLLTAITVAIGILAPWCFGTFLLLIKGVL